MIRPRSGQSLISSTNAFTVFSGLRWSEGRDVSSAVCIPIQDWYILSDYQHRWCWCWLAVSHSAGCFVLLIAKRQAKTQWTRLSWKLLMTVNWAELEAADTRRKVKEKSNVALSAETSFVSTWWWNSKHVGLCVCFVEIQGSAEPNCAIFLSVISEYVLKCTLFIHQWCWKKTDYTRAAPTLCSLSTRKHAGF